MGTLEPISDLAAVREGMNNRLTWTDGVGATGVDIARSRSGVGDPGSDGGDNGWGLVATGTQPDGDHLDVVATEFFYSVRWTDGIDVSAWSNIAHVTGMPSMLRMM